MKKRKHVLLLGGLLLAAFIAVSALVFYISNQEIKDGYLASEGSAAENFAVLTAGNIHLTDAQVEQLKSLSYSELQQSEENQYLEKMMSNSSFATKVDYAYIMIHLRDEEVKYKVDNQSKKQFDAPVGTNLDIMWLLDVNVSEDADSHEMNSASDLDRYSYYIDEDAQILGQEPTHIYNSSEWGDHICGYAPLYSEEGNYIGAVGVELQVGDYAAYCGRAVLAMGTLMAVTLMMLTLVFLYIYRQYRKSQMEKIYTDALTQMPNRSYYNDRFIKQMNSTRRNKHYLALMIMDIDLFKRVNDTFGHEIGDAVLIEMSEVIMQSFHPKQIARLGGEEFVAGVWVDNPDEMKIQLDLFFETIRKKRFSKLDLNVTLSVGCSYYHPDEVNGWSLSGMLRAADCCLYYCKGNGRNQYKIEEFDPKKEYKKIK